MKKKRLISFLSAITIVATGFTTGVITVNADTEDYGVLPAIIDDTATPDVVDALAENYTVTANDSNGDGIIDVIVTADNLQKHTAGGDKGKGYWIGFAVTAPEGVDGIDYVFVDAQDKENPSEYQLDTVKDELEQNIDGEGNDGIAFYVNAGAVKPKCYAMLQWYAGDTTFGERIEYKIDLTNVTLAEQLDITAADVKTAKLSGQPYSEDTYSVTANDADGVIEVNVSVTDLKKHNNSNGTPGYWTGFALTAPAGATHFRYAFSADEVTEASLGNLEAVEPDVDSDGNSGVAFYTDYPNPKTNVALQWFDEDGCRMSDIEYFTINLDNVDLDWINEDTITPAIIADSEINYTEHTIATSQTDGIITVELHTKDLKKHPNADGQNGYWTGFAIEAPQADAKATYTFGDTIVSVPSSIEEAVAYDEEGNPVNGLAFYTDAGSSNAKTEVTVEWFDADDNSICAETTFIIDLTSVTLDGVEYITNVSKANIVNQNNTATAPYSSYAVSSQVADDNTVTVHISMTNLKSHKAQNGETKYWTGFAVEAPEAGAQFKYAFSDTKDALVLGNITPAETGAVINSDGSLADGVAFYTDFNNPKRFAAIQWFSSTGEVLTNVTYFEMNLDKVKLYVTPTGGGGSGVISYTVTFNTNGGSNISSAKVQSNGTVTEPAAPVKENYIFDGWYTDKNLTEKYDFSAKVVKSFTLYAKWIENKKDTSFDFSDVSPDSWYYQEVKAIIEAGLMNGISQNEFSPDSELTRAMFVTILYRAEKEPEVKGNIIFADVPEDAYYADAVIWAVDNGIVTGITKTEFAPDLNITREQMSVMLYRYAQSKGETITTNAAVSYTDGNLISDYAKEAVSWTTTKKIMNGYEDGSFGPSETATRAQVAAVLVRYLGL